MRPLRRRKTSLSRFVLVISTTSVLSMVMVFVSITLFLTIFLSIFLHVDTKSSSAIRSSRQNSLIPLRIGTAWTGARNRAVVDEAIHIASALYNCGADRLDTCYDASQIPEAIAYWQTTCPGCSTWQNGNLQCVMLLTAAFGLVGQPLPFVGNAIDFFSSGAYLHTPGWEELSPLSLPEPGDIIVLSSPFFGGLGHVILVVDVQPPQANQPGYVQFAEANGPGSINQEPLLQDANGNLHMQIWTDYSVKCYIRHIAAVTAQ